MATKAAKVAKQPKQPKAERPDRMLRSGTRIDADGVQHCRRCGGVVSMADRECGHPVERTTTRYLVEVAPVLLGVVADGLGSVVLSDDEVTTGTTIDRRETQPDGTTVVAQWRVTAVVPVTETVTAPCGQPFGRFLVSAAKRREWRRRVLRKLARRPYVPQYLRDAVENARSGKAQRALYAALVELRTWHAMCPAPLPGRPAEYTHPLVAACRRKVLPSERAMWA